MKSDRIDLANRPRRYTKTDRYGRTIEVEMSPAAKISREEKMAQGLMKAPRYSPENDYQRRNNGPETRARKARGHILAVNRLTGENPNEIMKRLLTDEEISRIHPFTCRITWS